MFGGERQLIRESLYFEFDGRASDEEFGIRNISISTGAFNEPFLPSRTINEVSVPYNNKPYFINTRKDPKSLTLGFYPDDGWNDETMNAIARWLDVEEYKPLVFSSMPDKVMYAIFSAFYLPHRPPLLRTVPDQCRQLLPDIQRNSIPAPSTDPKKSERDRLLLY